jgi:hypothetical protein
MSVRPYSTAISTLISGYSRNGFGSFGQRTLLTAWSVLWCESCRQAFPGVQLARVISTSISSNRGPTFREKRSPAAVGDILRLLFPNQETVRHPARQHFDYCRRHFSISTSAGYRLTHAFELSPASDESESEPFEIAKHPITDGVVLAPHRY